jgi:prophage regulatory protein
MKKTEQTDDVTKLDKLLTAGALSELLALSKRQVFRLNSSGRIPAPVRIGCSVRWRASDIVKWIEWDCHSRAEFNARKGAGHNE